MSIMLVVLNGWLLKMGIMNSLEKGHEISFRAPHSSIWPIKQT